MAADLRNPNIARLAAGYLFPTIGKKKREYAEANPDKKLISLGIGDTTEPLPPSVAKAMSDYCLGLGTAAGYSGYDPPIENDVKAKVAEVMYPGCDLTPAEIFVSDGSKCDLGRLQWLFNGNAKVAVQDPAYPVYVDSSVMFGRCDGEQNAETGQYPGITYMPCTPENSFFPDLAPAAGSDIILFCNPNNPTGACATRAQLTTLVEFAIANKQMIVYDSAYAPFIQDPDKPKSIFEIPGAKTCAIESSSLSKLAGFTGVRLGWTVVPKELVFADGSPVGKDWGRIMGTLFNGAANVAQAGAIAALSNMEETTALVTHYMGNAKIIMDTFTGLGMEVHGGTDAPYVFVRFPGRDSWDVFQEIMEKVQVVTTPGAGFGPSGQGFVRVSAFGNRENVLEACARFKEMWA